MSDDRLRGVAPATGITTLKLYLFAEKVSDEAVFVSMDHLGSSRAGTTELGVLSVRYEFDPWGRGALVEGTNSLRQGFTGHMSYTSGSPLLTYFRAYDPELGRWLSDDPLPGGALEGDGPNLQWYGRNNPIRFTDPFGLVCGQPGNEWLVPDSLGGGRFTEACRQHDQCYENCEPSQI